MTVAPRTSPLAVADVADAAAALRERGGRLSRPRRDVLEALFSADGPVSAEYLSRGRDGRGTRLELTTVYRALEHLEELGVVRHVHLGHGPGLYGLVGEEEREYLMCERCDRVTSVDAGRLDAVRAQIRAAFGYEARFSHFPIVGLCAVCAKREHQSVHHGNPDEHAHEAHTHEHSHEAHTHEHSHGDHLHAHTHAHEQGLESEHRHGH